MGKIIHTLWTEHDRHLAMADLLEIPLGWSALFQAKIRTIPQNSAIHGCVTDVAKSLDWQWAGERRSLKEFKTLGMSFYRHEAGEQNAKTVPGFAGEIVDLSLHTSDLTVPEASEFIELMQMLKAQILARRSQADA